MDLAWRPLKLAQTFGQSHVSLSEQVHHSMDSCSSDDAQIFCKHTDNHYDGKIERGENPKHIWVSPVLAVTQCAESVTSSLLSCVQPSRLFPDVPMNCITAHYYTLLLTSSLLALSLPFPSQSFLIFGTCFIGSWSEYLILKLRITLTNSCGRLCSLVITVSFGPFFFSCIKFTFYSHTHSTQALILLYLLLLSSQLHTIWRD